MPLRRKYYCDLYAVFRPQNKAPLQKTSVFMSKIKKDVALLSFTGYLHLLCIVHGCVRTCRAFYLNIHQHTQTSFLTAIVVGLNRRILAHECRASAETVPMRALFLERPSNGHRMTKAVVFVAGVAVAVTALASTVRANRNRSWRRGGAEGTAGGAVVVSTFWFQLFLFAFRLHLEMPAFTCLTTDCPRPHLAPRARPHMCIFTRWRRCSDRVPSCTLCPPLQFFSDPT